MAQGAVRILIPVLFASCTALSQKDSYLDGLPRVAAPAPAEPVLVFSDDFESGLGKWNQQSGIWTTATPAANGLALKSPTSPTPTTFNVSTLYKIDMTGKTGCFLEYEISFSLGSLTGVSAKFFFGATTVASFKENAGLTAVTSSGQFLSRKIQLPDNTNDKLTIQTSVTNTTTGAADILVDNLKITCGKTAGTSSSVVNEDFEAGAANWIFQSPWANTAGAGANNTSAASVPLVSDNADHIASFTPNISLQGRFGCKISYFYTQNITSSGGATCYGMEWNGARIDTRCTAGITSGTSELYLTAYEGTPTNSLIFRCRDSNDGTTSIACAMDNVIVTCQQ